MNSRYSNEIYNSLKQRLKGQIAPANELDPDLKEYIRSIFKALRKEGLAKDKIARILGVNVATNFLKDLD